MRTPTTPDDQYRFWRVALSAKANPDEPVFIDEIEQPQPGFYRLRRVAARKWWPIAIWVEQPTDEDGDLVGPETVVMKKGNFVLTDEFEIYDIWMRCLSHPVSEEAYRFAVEHDRWADDPEPKEALEPLPKIYVNEQAPIF